MGQVKSRGDGSGKVERGWVVFGIIVRLFSIYCSFLLF